jgi:hypothetical protein
MGKDPFNSAAGGDQLKSHVGQLVLITPRELIPGGFKGDFGTVDVMRADAVFLDDGPSEPIAPEDVPEIYGMSVINAAIVKELKGALGDGNGAAVKPILGRLELVPNKRSPLKPILVLQSATDADKVLARAFFAWQDTPRPTPVVVDPFD